MAGQDPVKILLTELDKASLTTHVQHLVVRLDRALTRAQQGEHKDQAQTRLDKALEQLEQGLREAAQDDAAPPAATSQATTSTTTTGRSMLQLAIETELCRRSLQVRRADQQRLQNAIADRVLREIESGGAELPHKIPAQPGPSSNTSISMTEAAISTSAARTRTVSNDVASYVSTQFQRDLGNAFIFHSLLTQPSELEADVRMARLMRKEIGTGDTLNAHAKTRLGRELSASEHPLQQLFESNNPSTALEAWSRVRLELWTVLEKSPLGNRAHSLFEERLHTEEAFDPGKAVKFLRDIAEQVRQANEEAKQDDKLKQFAATLDEQFDKVFATLDDTLSNSSQRVVFAFRQIVAILVASYEDDMLANDDEPMGPGQSRLLPSNLIEIAAENERDLVYKICRAQRDRGLDVSFEEYAAQWLKEHLSETEVENWGRTDYMNRVTLFVKATVSMITRTDAVTSSRYYHQRRDDSNFVPPYFLVTISRLYSAQMKLEAATIVACLVALFDQELLSSRSTTTFQSSLSESTSTNSTPTVADKLYVMLMSAAKERDPTPESTRMTNLADELVRASKALFDAEGTTGAKTKVLDKQVVMDKLERVLRYEDAVFKLLKTRLHNELQEQVTTFVLDETGLRKREAQTESGLNGTIGLMKTAKPRVKLTESGQSTTRIGDLDLVWTDVKFSKPVKGFELVQEGVNSLLLELCHVVGWATRVWFKEIAAPKF
ncbi:hypothetical protein ACM66B_001902 [Microbotryomycetes sp. NB124-2]